METLVKLKLTPMGKLWRILQVWNKFPGMRLGQLIDNAMYDQGVDLFYIDDMKLIKLLEEYPPKEPPYLPTGLLRIHDRGGSS